MHLPVCVPTRIHVHTRVHTQMLYARSQVPPWRTCARTRTQTYSHANTCTISAAHLCAHTHVYMYYIRTNANTYTCIYMKKDK